MAIGAFAEPLVVISLLFGGVYLNRNTFGDVLPIWEQHSRSYSRSNSPGIDARAKRSDELSGGQDASLLGHWPSTGSLSSSGANTPLRRSPEPLPYGWRTRRIGIFRRSRSVRSPDTSIHKDRLLSRVLRRYPFLAEAWYWALIYWVYQLGRAFTALTLVQDTVDVARTHALQLIHLEQRLNIFIELPVQRWFLDRPSLLHWINRTYSFIHIPGTILFLVLLYYFTTTQPLRAAANGSSIRPDGSRVAGPRLYEARRRSMAMCNLIAFIGFTLWPCMPPRLLSDPNYDGTDAHEAKSFGFVDTVHSATGESSVWTTNKFCNQYAAMPSLHFGYSLLIGLTVASFPLQPGGKRVLRRLAIVVGGMAYPALILTAIVATANHFVLDAVAGAVVCAIAWHTNGFLLNFLVLEDYFLSLVRIHKPVTYVDPREARADELESALPIWTGHV